MTARLRFRVASVALSVLATAAGASCQPALVTVTTTTQVTVTATGDTSVIPSSTTAAATSSTPAATTGPSTTITTAGTGPFVAPWEDRSVYRRNLVAAEQESLSGLPGATVYRINVQIAPGYLSLTGHEDVRYTNRETVNLDSIYFQLFPSMTGGRTAVIAATIDGLAAPYVYEYEGASLKVSPSRALAPGTSITLGLDFTVSVPPTVMDNYGLFGYTNNVLALNGFYPAIPAYDATGWHAGPYPPLSDNTYQDAAFYLVKVTAPVKLVMAASGSQVERQEAGGNQVVIYAAGPARDFYLAGSEKYTVLHDSLGSTEINCYMLPGESAGAGIALGAAKAALNSYDSRIAAYPYAEFDIMPLDLQDGAAGIEYPGIIGVDMDLFIRRTELEATVAHEAAHQWFYNAVGDDQINQPWLDEAMAQYLTGLYYLDAHGQSGWQSQKQDWNIRWSRVQFASIPIGLPSGSYTELEYDAILYGRGPLFIDALAARLGSNKFSRFLKDYYQANKWQVATTAIYQTDAEAACGCDLGALFKQWVLPA